MCRFSLCIPFICLISKIFIFATLWCQNIKKLRKTQILSHTLIHKRTPTERKQPLNLKYTNIWILKSREKPLAT